MQQAAIGLATVCARLLEGVYGRRVALLVGTGNNGGDALFAGAFLARRGARVAAVLLAPERAHGAGLAALRRDGGRVLPAGFGGGRVDRPGRPGASTACSASAAGAGCDPRRPTSPARPTAAPGSPSPSTSPAGSTPPPAPSRARRSRRCTRSRSAQSSSAWSWAKAVGTPARSTWSTSASARTCRRRPSPGSPTPTPPPASPSPPPDDDKYSQGVVGVVAGSATYPGAGVLCTGAALRARPGLVRYAGTAADGVRAAWPEAIVTDGRPADAGRVQAWVAGPGMGTDDDARSVLAEVLATDLPVIVDADGLTMLAKEPDLVRGRDARHRPDPARPRVRPLRRRARRRPGGRGPAAGRGARLRRPAQGRRHRRGRRRRDGVRQRHGHPVARHRRHRRRPGGHHRGAAGHRPPRRRGGRGRRPSARPHRAARRGTRAADRGRPRAPPAGGDLPGARDPGGRPGDWRA